MDRLDALVISTNLIFTICSAILLLLPIPYMHKVVGDVLVILTHAMIVPSFIVFYHDKWYYTRGLWYVVIVLNSVIASIIYHVFKIIEMFQTETSHWDISSQNFLLLATGVLLLDEENDPNEMAYVGITVCAIFVASFGEIKLFSVKIFEWIAFLLFLVVAYYVIKRTCTPNDKRKNIYLHISMVLVLAAGVTFTLSTGSIKHTLKDTLIQKLDDTYGIIHSMWHVYAYSMLYFLLKSIVDHPILRQKKRVRFNENIEYRSFHHNETILTPPFLDQTLHKTSPTLVY